MGRSADRSLRPKASQPERWGQSFETHSIRLPIWSPAPSPALSSPPLWHHYWCTICQLFWQGRVIQALGKCKLISYLKWHFLFFPPPHRLQHITCSVVVGPTYENLRYMSSHGQTQFLGLRVYHAYRPVKRARLMCLSFTTSFSVSLSPAPLSFYRYTQVTGL